MRRLRPFFALLLALCVAGPNSASRTAVYPEAIVIRAWPVTIQPGDPRRVRVGELTLLAGWALTSESPQFGGWSALDVAGDRITAIGDAGSVLRFRLGRFGHASEARIDPLPSGCGATANKFDRDSESLTRTGTGDWLVGFEWHNSMCRIAPGFDKARALRAPPEMARWRRTRGPESLLRLRDGRTLVVAEGNPDGSDLRQMLIFADDPTRADAKLVRRWYRPPAGTNPTDAAQLPDGRILIVNRRFSVLSLFTAVVVVIDPAMLDAPVLAGRTIARFEPPVLSDNYEGLSVSVENGRPVVWMISDDNFFNWQRSYLLKFGIDPAPTTVRPPPGSPS